jgi:hypothetical protein
MINKERFLPMLLSNEEQDINHIQYPVFASTKYDGVRVEITNKGLFGRSLKPIPNKDFNDKFLSLWSSLPDDLILEGELYHYGKPCREISGIVNSSKDKKNIDGFCIMLFDLYDGSDSNWLDRRKKLERYTNKYRGVYLAEGLIMNNSIVLQDYYDYIISKGFEGLVIMNLYGKYKQGRLSNKMGIGYKLKPVRTDDLEIIGVNERLENLNTSEINELGYSFKRNTINDKQGTGLAASFTVLLPNKDTTGVTITGTEEERKAIWDNRESYIGRTVVVKSMDYGAKDKLRFPRMIRVKELSEE